MRTSVAPVPRRAARTSATSGASSVAAASRSLCPSRAIRDRGPDGSGPPSAPSHRAKTAGVDSGTRGFTSRTGVPDRSLSTSSSSVPVPRPMQASLLTQAGTSAPSLAARSCQSSGKPYIRSTTLNTAPASADPPPRPAATGRRFSRLTVNPLCRGRRDRACETMLPNGASSSPAKGPVCSNLSSAASAKVSRSPSSTKAKAVSSS